MIREFFFPECLNDKLKKTEVDKCTATGTGLEALTQKVLAAEDTNQNMNAECTYVSNHFSKNIFFCYHLKCFLEKNQPTTIIKKPISMSR